MQRKKIVFLASDCESSRWVYNSLIKDFYITTVILEQPISRKLLFKNRVKKIGLFKVIGQVLFTLIVVPYLRKKGRLRKAEIAYKYGLDNREITKCIKVESINDHYCKQELINLQPDIVIVNGTRIINKKILQCTNAMFINMHVGITPWYRGSHGGYWSLYNNDIKNFGTTIHIVDAGVDTGSVLKQVFILPDKKDNFTTYPVVQAAIGIKALKEVLPKIGTGNFEIKKHNHKGNIYYQPTIWQYLLKKIN
jgi:methionyl-tRNA formyltransferase